MIPADAIRRACDNDIAITATQLGVVLRKASATERVGPCPVCGGGTDRFSVNTKKQIWNCRGCARGGGVIDLVRHIRGCDFRGAIAWLNGETGNAESPIVRAPAPVAKPAPQPDNGEIALEIWRNGVEPRGTAAERYLASRALSIGDDIANAVIRWNPATRWRDDRPARGAMVSLMRSISIGEPQAVAVTFLAGDVKAGRIFLGPVMGAAIILDPFEDVLAGLHVGEGLETCMAARQLRLLPCWALGSAAAVAAFPVLAGVECLTLLQENDDPSARAVEACAARWHAAGREVFINEPTAGKDLNDAIRRSS